MHRVKSEKRQSAPPPIKHQNNNHPSSQGNVVPQFHHRLRNRNSNNRDSSLSPCSSDIMMSHSLNASSGSLSSVSDRSASTDCVEEYITDVPFAGKENHFLFD